MSNESGGIDFPGLSDETRKIWERNARWWDQRMAEGDRWHLTLIAPAVDRLLALGTGAAVLDLGCGNGWFARRLAQRGMRVFACDFSPTMIEGATARGLDFPITYHVVDLSDVPSLAAIGPAEFDGAICNMVIMDMPVITPLLRAVYRGLRAGGRFVFSIPHPCFNGTGSTLLAERSDYEGSAPVTVGVRVNRYLSTRPEKGLVDASQPEPHYYFHRPLSKLCASCFEAGFVLDGLEEPAFDVSARGKNALSWSHCQEIPPILVVRLLKSA